MRRGRCVSSFLSIILKVTREIEWRLCTWHAVVSFGVHVLTAAAEELKKTELLRLRHEARHDSKANAMATRTKDNLKVFTGGEDETVASDKAEEEPVVDLKHLFTKHDRRVPHLPSDKIPDVLSMMKERQMQKRLAREEARKASEAERVAQQKLESGTANVKSDLKLKKLSTSSHAVSDQKHRSAPSSSDISKSVSSHKVVESKAKVKKKNQPPPMSFQQLMSLAEQKQVEPVIDTQPNNVPKKVCTAQERPMTQEEKDRQKRRGTKEYQDWLKYGGHAPSVPSSGKSRHQQRAGKYHKDQRTTVSNKMSGNDSFDESDSETDETCSDQAQTAHSRNSYSRTNINTLKDGSDVPRKQPSATTSRPGKLFGSQSDSRHQSVERSKPTSGGNILFTKGKVRLTGAGDEDGQNGKSRSLSDDLIQKLKEERLKMVERGDAVPSLTDMLQDLLNKVQDETNQSKQSGSRSLKPNSNNLKSKKSVSEQQVQSVKSASDRSRSHSALASGTRPSYAAVNETVVDCAQDKSKSTKPVKASDKRPMKSTWEEMYERAKSKNPNYDHGIVLLTCLFMVFFCEIVVCQFLL